MVRTMLGYVLKGLNCTTVFLFNGHHSDLLFHAFIAAPGVLKKSVVPALTVPIMILQRSQETPKHGMLSSRLAGA